MSAAVKTTLGVVVAMVAVGVGVVPMLNGLPSEGPLDKLCGAAVAVTLVAGYWFATRRKDES